MGVEIEAKFRVDDPDHLRETLAAAGAAAMGAVLEDDTYFDTPDGRLLRDDQGLRLRVLRTPAGERAARPKAVLTYKGPRRKGCLKIRREEESAVDPPESVRAILAALGYEPSVSFQKRRESFRLGKARIELDELPGMGFFLEIEADDENTVQAARQAIGLAEEPTLTKTYAELVAEHIAAESPRAGVLRFRVPGSLA